MSIKAGRDYLVVVNGQTGKGRCLKVGLFTCLVEVGINFRDDRGVILYTHDEARRIFKHKVLREWKDKDGE